MKTRLKFFGHWMIDDTLTYHFGGLDWSESVDQAESELYNQKECDVCIDGFWIAPWAKKVINGMGAYSIDYAQVVDGFNFELSGVEVQLDD